MTSLETSNRHFQYFSRRATQALFLLGIIATILGSAAYWFLNRPLMIAYVGRYTDSSILDPWNETVLRSLLRDYNRESGHRKLKLLTFATRVDSRQGTSDSIYRHEIIPRSDVILVLDNTWGEDLRLAAEVIRESDIPVISMNADLGNINYGQNVIFLGHGDETADGVTSFVANVLDENSLVFISEESAADGEPYWLTRRFLELFDEVGMTLIDTLYVPGPIVTSGDSARLMNDLAALAQETESRTIVINTHRQWGAVILPHVDTLFSESRIVGGPYILGTDPTRFRPARDNELIVHTSPTDAVAEDVFLTLRRHLGFARKLGISEGTSSLFVKRNLDAVELLSLAIAALPDTVSLTRSWLLTFLQSLPGSTLATPREIYRFDSLGRVNREVAFEYRTKDFIRSYPYQLNQERNRISNITFGIELVEISDIDVMDNTFSADFYHWLRADGVESFPERLFHFSNLKDPGRRALVVERRVDETLYRLFKTSGAVFHQAYKLEKYPRDRQALTITAQITSPSDSFRVSFENASVTNRCTGIETVAIGAWVVRDCFATVDDQITIASRGDPSLNASEPQRFKVLNIRLQVERKFLQPFITIYLPLLLIGIAAISLLFINDLTFANLGDMSVGVFLSMVTYSIAYSQMTPQVGILTSADILFYSTFGAVLASFVGLVYANAHQNKGELVDKYLGRLRLVLSASYGLGVFWLTIR